MFLVHHSLFRNMSADKKRKNSVTKKKEMAADTEMTANFSFAAACNDSCHYYCGPEEKMEFSVLSMEDFISLPSAPLKPAPKKA